MSERFGFRTFASIPEEEIRLIHGLFKPAEIYQTQSVLVEVLLDENTEERRQFSVYRLSPIGVELEVSEFDANTLGDILSVGRVVEISLVMGEFKTKLNGVIVVSGYFERKKVLAGIRWVAKDQKVERDEERRLKRRWLCDNEFLPTGVAPNPVLYNDYIYFKIRDFSKDGLHISTSLRNKFIIKGMVLDANLTFPMVGQVRQALRVENCRMAKFDGKDYLSIGVSFVDADRIISEILGQYALQFSSEATVSELKKNGFLVPQASRAFEYSFVKTANDYREVLDLRLKTYGAVGKMKGDASPEIAGDVMDTRARILMVRHHEKLVGSMRVMFHRIEDQMEHEQFLKLPADFPPRHEIAEVTRICTDSSYRGSDLFFSIIKYMVLISAQAKKRWILGSATKKLLPMYTRVGFVPLPITYTHADLGNEEHVLMIIDVPKLLSGTGVTLSMWQKLYSDLVIYLQQQHSVVLTPVESLRLSVYQFIENFSQIFRPRNGEGE